MNLRRWCVSVQVLVFLVICIFPEVIHAGSSVSSGSSQSKSKGKTKSSRKDSSSSIKTRSADSQYGPLLLRPSKPDPHFEILDEQRAYYNYGGKLREGRSSRLDKKPSLLTEHEDKDGSSSSSSSSTYKKKCCTSNKKAKNSSGQIPASSALKEIPSPAFSTNSGRFSVESRFSKKSLDQNQYSGFSGSQLISGDVGMVSQRMIQSPEERVGWKILMGPSVSPAEEEEFSTTQNDDAPMMNKRAFTSLTDGGMGNHRTITKLMEVGHHKSHTHSQKKKGKATQSSSSSSNNYELLPEQFTSSQPDIRQKSSKRGKTTYKSSSLRSMQQSMQKHKYATVTKKSPSKSHSSSSSSTKRSGKKVQMSQQPSNKNSFKASTPMKSGKSSTRYTYTSNSGSFEEDLHSLRSSPVMTLDTKKLIIEPDASSVEPTVQNTMVSSMSRETYSAEKGLSDLTPLPSESSLLSRYDPITLPNDDMMMEDENEHGGDDGNDVSSIRYSYSQDDDLNHFQTKTALNPSSSEYPSFSVSASMNYAKGSRSHNHRRIPGGGRGTVTSASDEIPVHHSASKSRSKSRYPHIRHHVDHVPHYPDAAGLNFQDEHEHVNNISPEVVDPPRMDNRGFVINTLVQHPTPQKTPTQIEFAGLSSSKLHLPSLNGHLHATGPAPSKLPPPPPSPEMLSHPPEPTSGVHVSQLPYPGPSHHVPYILPPHHHHPPHPPPRRPPFPPPRFHHRHPIPLPLPPLPNRPPLHHPHLDGGSGRKAPGEFGIEIGTLVPGHSPPPPIGIDPHHPVVQHALKHPQSILNDGVYIEPTDSTSIQETTKKYFQNLHFNVHKNTLIPLDKRLVYLSMIFSWMFWITTFYTYYRYYAHGSHTKPVVLTVPQNGENPQVTTRALDTTSPWMNFTTVLEYIEIAQKTYEGFDWQDLNCQKRTLCELVQKQNEPWGETGRKLANGYVYRIMDALDGIPIPQVIQTYLRQYKEAITQGKNSNKDCGQIYPQCKFSIKEVINKSAAKKKA